MKKVIAAIALLLGISLPAHGRERVSGWCEQGGEQVTVGGLTSTENVQRSYPSCTITIFDSGTMDLTSIFSDDSGTVKANPFVASSTGFWFFYSNDGRVDVRLSGGGIVTPFTIGDILLNDTKNDVTTIVAVASSATPTFDASLGTIFTNTLTANVTSSTISNPVTGQRITIYLAQDGTGGRTFAWPANVQLRGGGYVVSDDVSAVSVIKLYYDGTNWREIGWDADEFGRDLIPVVTGQNIGSATARPDGIFDVMTTGVLNNVRVVDLLKFLTIQAAHDDLPSNGGAIFEPTVPTFSVTGVTNFTKPIHLYCAGKEASAIRTNQATGDVINITGQGVLIEDCRFNTSVARTAGAYVHFNTANGSGGVLRSFTMEAPFIGIHINADAGTRIMDGTIRNGVTTAGGAGILINGGNDHYINNVSMNAVEGLEPESGIRIGGTISVGSTNITDVGIVTQNVGLLMNPSAGSVASIFAINSFFDNSASRGISINPSGTGAVVRSHFIGTWSASSTNDQGVFIQNNGDLISGLEFIGHMSINNGSSGFQVDNATNISDIRVLGGTYAGNSGRGLTFAADVSEFSIIGVCSGACSNLTGNTQAGIQIDAGSSDNYFIALNDLRDNVGSALVDNGTGVNKVIFGNLPRSINNYLPQQTDFYRASSGSDAITATVDADANKRFAVRADGRISWGDGTSAADTTLYRGAADTLKTDDAFVYRDAPTLAASTTPSVVGGNVFLTNSTASITDFTGEVNGQVIILLCGADTTTSLTDSTPLFLAGAFTCTTNDTISLVSNGTVWYELSRGVN